MTVTVMMVTVLAVMMMVVEVTVMAVLRAKTVTEHSLLPLCSGVGLNTHSLVFNQSHKNYMYR